MPIKLPLGLPAGETLRREGVPVVTGAWSGPHGGPPLRIALLNLMPQKSVAETQIARLLGQAEQRVELTLLVPGSYRARTAPPAHLAAFYRPWPSVRDQDFDGLIVTGAPVETLPFEEVAYWDELTAVFDWAQARVRRSFTICWAAQAALHRAHGVPKHRLDQKLFGVFDQQAGRPDARLMKGLEHGFPTPVSRHTEVRAADLPRDRGLDVLASSPDSGLCLLEDRPRRTVYMFDHLEYDADSLRTEYRRDRDAGLAVALPRNYFPDDDPTRAPVNGWCGAARSLFGNWLDLIAGDIAEDSEGRSTRDQEMAWLLAAPRHPLQPQQGFTDFLVSGVSGDDLLPRVLRALAGKALSPLAVKVHKAERGCRLIELRLDGIGAEAAQRLAQHMLRLPPVRRVTYRGANDAGGTFAARGLPLGAPGGREAEVRAHPRDPAAA